MVVRLNESHPFFAVIAKFGSKQTTTSNVHRNQFISNPSNTPFSANKPSLTITSTKTCLNQTNDQNKINHNHNPTITTTKITWPLVVRFVWNPFNQPQQYPQQQQSIECLECYGVVIPFALIVSLNSSLHQHHQQQKRLKFNVPLITNSPLCILQATTNQHQWWKNCPSIEL